MPQVFGIVEIIGKCFCQCQYVSITFGRHLYLLELLLLAQRIKQGLGSTYRFSMAKTGKKKEQAYTDFFHLPLTCICCLCTIYKTLSAPFLCKQTRYNFITTPWYMYVLIKVHIYRYSVFNHSKVLIDQLTVKILFDQLSYVDFPLHVAIWKPSDILEQPACQTRGWDAAQAGNALWSFSRDSSSQLS